MQNFKKISITEKIGNNLSFIKLSDCLIELTQPFNDMQSALAVNRENNYEVFQGQGLPLAPSPSYWRGFVLYDEDGFSMWDGAMELPSNATFEAALKWLFDDGVGPGILERVGSFITVNQFDKNCKNIITKGDLRRC